MDRYPSLGRKITAATEQEAMDLVRAVWPSAHKEGSTGFERSWWVERELVAHQWPKNNQTLEPLWVRVSKPATNLASLSNSSKVATKDEQLNKRPRR